MSKLAEFQAAWAPRSLAALRIMSALLFIQHGTQKLLQFPPRPAPPPGAPPMGPPEALDLFSVMGVAGSLELVGGTLLVIGLFTRPVAFILSGMMAVAYFMAHAGQSFYPILNRGELAIMFCFVFLYLFFAGGGAWSLDGARKSGA